MRLSASEEKNKSVRHPPGRKRSNPRNHRNHEYLPKWHNHRISAEPEHQHLQLAAASGGQRLRPGPSSSHARVLSALHRRGMCKGTEKERVLPYSIRKDHSNQLSLSISTSPLASFALLLYRAPRKWVS